MSEHQAIIFVKECQNLINSTTRESLLDAIECLAQNDEGQCNEVIIPDLCNMLRLVEQLSNHITIDQFMETENKVKEPPF